MNEPSCQNGPSILDAQMLGESLVVQESSDGRWFCFTYGRNGPEFGSVPDSSSTDIQVTSSGQSGTYAWYVVEVGAAFPDAVTVHNENGDDLPVARGSAGDYLLIFDPFVGQPQQPTDGAPPLVDRTFDLLAADGSLVTQLRSTTPPTRHSQQPEPNAVSSELRPRRGAGAHERGDVTGVAGRTR